MTRKYPIKVEPLALDAEQLARMGFATMAEFRADAERGRINTARFFAGKNSTSTKARPPFKMADYDSNFKRNVFVWKLLRSC